MTVGRRWTGRGVVASKPGLGHKACRLTPLALAASALAGCTTFGTNVEGSFSCVAPDGTCAPSSVIDDRALAMISGDQPAASPAGPYRRGAGMAASGVASVGKVARTGQKVLRIVFPANVDAQGRFHEASAVRAVVDDGTWVAATTDRGSLAVALEPLPLERPGLAATPPKTSPIVTAVPAPTVSSPRALPAPEKVAAARELARTAAASSVAAPAAAPGVSVTREAIAADVGRALAAPPRNRPTPFPGKVED